MGNKSKIEWTDATWNPVTGCTPASEGCRNCYAKRLAKRFPHIHGITSCGMPFDPVEAEPLPFSKIVLHEDRLEHPLKWKRPRRIFVCSMGDLFHQDVPFIYVLSIFEIMRTARQHNYIILTKRPKRMAEFTRWIEAIDSINIWRWPTNCSLGVSVENQDAADKRIPILLKIPAATRFVSCEPLIGPVTLKEIHYDDGLVEIDALTGNHGVTSPLAGLGNDKLDWVIVGGESGPGARPMEAQWVRTIRDQCIENDTPFFFKQWGGGKKNGRHLDGRTWNEMPLVMNYVKSPLPDKDYPGFYYAGGVKVFLPDSRVSMVNIGDGDEIKWNSIREVDEDGKR